MRLFRQKGGGFDARYIEHPPASLARNFIVQKHHVTRGFHKLGSIPLVRLPRQGRDFFTDQPAQFIGIGGSAKVAVQSGWLHHLRFPVKSFFVQFRESAAFIDLRT
jgi:hypothetical protein